MKQQHKQEPQNKMFNDIIAQNWDQNIFVRAEDIENGTDITYKEIILPWVTETLKNIYKEKDKILDVGCGCGYLTKTIHNTIMCEITGIDISKASINYALKKYPYINFICDDVCLKKFDKPFDIITAVMTLNNMPDAELFFESAKKCLKEHGKMIIVIPHPFFWPIKHFQKKDISYNKENHYEIIFATKGRKDYPSKTIYFHRSLETYIEYINKAGYYIDEYKEMYEGSEFYPDILGLVLKPKNNI